MTSSERLQWGAIGAAIVAAVISLIVGYSSISQNKEFKASDLSSRIGVLEERTRTLDIAAIKRELESIRRDQALLVSKSVNQKRFFKIEVQIQSIIRKFSSIDSTPPNVDIDVLAKTIVDQYAEQIRGLKGNIGAIGERGPTGPKGSDGLQGVPGVRGQNGENGSDTKSGNTVSADEIDRYIDKAVRKAMSALPVTKSSNTSISTIPEGKIFGSGDCVELNPLKRTVSANLAFGGSICLDGVPYATISHENGCSFIAFSTNKKPNGENVRIGKRLTIAIEDRKITILPGCKKKDNRWYYPTRIIWQ